MATAASYFEIPLVALLRELRAKIVRLMGAECTVFGLATASQSVREWHRLSRWKSAYARSFSWISRAIPSRRVAMACTTLVWCALIAVLICVATAFIASFPALLLGAMSGYYTLLVCQFVRIRGLKHNQPRTAVLFAFNGKDIEVISVASQLREFCAPLWERSSAALLAGIISALSLVAFQTWTQTFDVLFRTTAFSSVESVLAWFGPVLVSIWFISGAGISSLFERKVVERIQRSVTCANLELRRVAELEGYLAAVNISAWALRNDPAQRYQRAICEYVSSNCAEVVLDPAAAVSVVQALKVLAQQEIRQTQAAVQQYQNALMQFRELRGYARAAQDISLKRAVDAIGERLAQSRKLMEAQDFSGLAQLLETLQREMQSLDSQLARAHQSRVENRVTSAAQWTSPYDKLGISRDATSEQIRRLRTKLVQIYHPDAFGASPNAGRMAEINAAVDQILKWRGEK